MFERIRALFKPRHGLGLKEQPVDNRDWKLVGIGDNKPEIDMTSLFPEATFQNGYNSCTAHAVCALLDFTLMYHKSYTYWTGYNSSEAYLWYMSRLKEGTQNQNSGVILRNVFKTIKEKGFVRQEDWDYSNGIFTYPSTKTNLAAEFYKLYISQLPSYYYIMKGDLNTAKNCLSNGYPLVFGFPIYSNFQLANKSNQLITDFKGDLIGNHAMLAVGYNKDGIIVRNSWGTNWGSNGYCTISYDLFKLNSFDMWTLR